MATGGLIYSGAVLLFYNRQGAPSSCSSCRKQGDPAPAPSVAAWREKGSSFASQTYLEELAMGMPLLRRWLVSRACGRVLETGVGPGRNLGYYPGGKAVSELVLTDAAEPMVRLAAEAARAAKLPWVVKVLPADSQKLADALGPGPQFDTVVDTFGLCSVADPAEALASMITQTRPGGLVLLLEHGRPPRDHWLRYFFGIDIGGVLDRGRDSHIEKWGCDASRDLDDVIAQGVKRSGRAVSTELHSRWHLGTTAVVALRIEKSKD
jgi:methyltransferase OMS1